MRRKAISKKTRFEVFKRDSFKCVYCGAHPPGVLLHVDHVVAVANGGDNHIDNLVSACAPCNLGKGATALDSVPETMASKAIKVAEMEEQLIGYQRVMQARRERLEDEQWAIAEYMAPGSSEKGMHRDWTLSIRNFIEKLGFDDVLDSAERAKAKFPHFSATTFRYFCGICWNKIKKGAA